MRNQDRWRVNRWSFRSGDLYKYEFRFAPEEMSGELLKQKRRIGPTMLSNTGREAVEINYMLCCDVI